jgi:nucleotidyltransferase/DNA polymerase involved in DNA repair
MGNWREAMFMELDDLARLKHVGASRRKLLNDHGITTVQQLCDMPEEKLAGIKSIGGHYAKLIKNSVTEYYREKHETLPAKKISAKERKVEEINRELQKKREKLENRLDRLNEDLKPLGKGKYLGLYIEFKKISGTAKAHIKEIEQRQQNLPRKTKKNIIEKTSDLTVFLKKTGKKPKKKKYKNINRKIQAFSNKLQDLIS